MILVIEMMRLASLLLNRGMIWASTARKGNPIVLPHLPCETVVTLVVVSSSLLRKISCLMFCLMVLCWRDQTENLSMPTKTVSFSCYFYCCHSDGSTHCRRSWFYSSSVLTISCSNLLSVSDKKEHEGRRRKENDSNSEAPSYQEDSSSTDSEKRRWDFRVVGDSTDAPANSVSRGNKSCSSER